MVKAFMRDYHFARAIHHMQRFNYRMAKFHLRMIRRFWT